MKIISFLLLVFLNFMGVSYGTERPDDLTQNPPKMSQTPVKTEQAPENKEKKAWINKGDVKIEINLSIFPKFDDKNR